MSSLRTRLKKLVAEMYLSRSQVKKLVEFVKAENKAELLKERDELQEIIREQGKELEEARADVGFWKDEFASMVKQRDEARRYARKYYKAWLSKKSLAEVTNSLLGLRYAEFKEAQTRIAELEALTKLGSVK